MAIKKDKCTCSFCGKSKEDVVMMISGKEGVYACNECIVAMYDTLASYEEERKRQIASTPIN